MRPTNTSFMVATMCRMRAIEMDDYIGLNAITFPFIKGRNVHIRRMFSKAISEHKHVIVHMIDRYRDMPQANACQEHGTPGSGFGWQLGEEM
jgi:hypothetical protein